MALYGMADNNIQIPAGRDGAMYNSFAGNIDYVIKGIGDEFEVTYSASSLTITLGTGEGVICGRHVTEVQENATNTTIQLSANSSGYIVIRMDLTRPAGSETYLTAVSVLQRDDLNNGGTIADLALYEYVTGASGMSRITDVRKIKTTPHGDMIVYVTQSGSTYMADKSYADIFENINEGGQPIAVLNNTVYHLVGYTSVSVIFGLFMNDLGEGRVAVLANGTVNYLVNPVSPTYYYAVTLGSASATSDSTIYSGGYRLTVTNSTITTGSVCNIVFPNGDYSGNVTWITSSGSVALYFDQNPNSKALRVEWKTLTYSSATIS